ncbi:la-related protein 7-like [Tribolium madens]|uniref:la-related protein 7-like n=1 Tax=Tribolium madens TaxID=41895 RepID=UPI001CF73C86|nr:la-related protein 7-like [Tribolium madens]
MDNELKENENVNDDPVLKKGRHRKKQLYNSILQQMEFYFSDSNLTKDRFLSQLIKENPFVDLSVFLKFNKIRKLTTNIEDIQKAVQKSQLIELSEDRNSICRTKPVKEKNNVDECTIYVERLKSDATHEWLSSVFSEFGNVVYVSIPKYKNNNAIKGFAFIEFEKEKEAQNALNYFESIGCKMPSNTEPETLCSIKTFQESNEEHPGGSSKNSTKKRQAEEHCESVEKDKSTSKRKFEENEEVQSDKIVKKIKTENSKSEEDEKITRKQEFEEKEHSESEEKKKKLKDDCEHIEDEEKNENSTRKRKLEENEHSESEEKEKNSKLDTGDVSESDDTENKKKKKLKKEHRKKNYIKDLGLQVLSKKEWKKMRNRYLDLQKKKMKEFKTHLLKAKFNQAKYEEKSKAPTTKTELKKEDYTKGLIVKIKLAEVSVDTKKLKNEIKSSSPDIMYVDIPNPGSENIYIRFNTSGGAKKFSTQECFGKKEVVTGEEESLYWEKIKKDREDKVNKAKKKQRGRDKLLKKAKHTKFDD